MCSSDLKVNFGAMFAGGIAINKARFDRLPAEVQTAIREAGDEWTAQYARAQGAAVNAAFQGMLAAGARSSELSAAERQRWAEALPQVAKLWSADAQGKGLPANEVLGGYTGGLTQGGAKLPRDWNK